MTLVRLAWPISNPNCFCEPNGAIVLFNRFCLILFSGTVAQRFFLFPEYLGSFIIDPSDEITLSSLDMTIQLCVEICRVNNKTYSLLSVAQCRCKDTPPDSSNIITTGLMACANFEMQVCGKTGYSASIYKTGDK